MIAAGLSALTANAQSFKGSDTLFEITNDVIAACPAASGLTYLGTGSSNGEKAIAPGGGALATQQIAPMSRFFNGGSSGAVCKTGGITATASNGATVAFTQTQVQQGAAGIVCGLDGLSVYGAKETAGKSTCNGPALSKTITWNAGQFLTYNGSCSSSETVSYDAGSYTFVDWTDVLRVVYAGLDHSGTRNCRSAVRAAVVENWGRLFENGETDANNCNTLGDSSSTCTQLRHAFRRDDYSGTTDTFASLIGIGSIGRFSNNQVKSDPFCNSIQSNVSGSGTEALPAGLNDYPPDYRDRDPIRRCAAGTNNAPKGGTQPPTNVATEQVSALPGKLGLVLAINPMSEVKAGGQPNGFPTDLCAATSILGQAPTPTIDKSTGGDVVSSSGRCLNGDAQLFGQCRYPTFAAAAGLDANCMGSQQIRPSVNAGPPTPLEGVGQGAVDGRVYNSVVLLTDYSTTPPQAAIVRDLNGHRIVGAFAKLHTSRTMNLPDTSVGACQNLDATGQIACLTVADRCSIGFAGRGGAGTYNVAELPIRNVLPTDANLLNQTYPLTRKLYLDQVLPASFIWGTEAAYEACYINSCKTIMTNRGFLGVDPYCEDFNEEVLCPGAGANSTAGCDAKKALYPALGNTTVCGNAATESYEEGDTGATNHDTCTDPEKTAGATICTTGCRFKKCF